MEEAISTATSLVTSTPTATASTSTVKASSKETVTKRPAESISSVNSTSSIRPKSSRSVSSASPSTIPKSLQIRSASGGVSTPKRTTNGSLSVSNASHPTKASPPNGQRPPSSSSSSKSMPIARHTAARKEVPVPLSQSRSASDGSSVDSSKKPSARTHQTNSLSNNKSSMSNASSSRAGSNVKRAHSVTSPASTFSSSATSSLKKSGSLTASVNHGTLSGRRKSSTANVRDSRFLLLPQVDFKMSDELRLDLRGHRVRSLKMLKLSEKLEFVYLRDNLLSALEGIEALKRVKVLDLSFNDFKVVGFEPLGICQAIQQLYLAGNQITSLSTLPELPNLEFLSVAQNKLKSLSMATQPRLQVLAASKNKISTLKAFPHLPSLENLRLEENPILDIPHIEAACMLLVGPTLKKFNDRDLMPSEVQVAKLYPACTAMCLRDGWEFCSPDIAAESTFSFLLQQWNDKFPPGYMIKEASVVDPYEGDACHCNFSFTNICGECVLKLKYQWYLGDTSPTNFVPISDATGEVYWPKHEDIGRVLKVECTPLLGCDEYSPVFAISRPVSRGTGIPKVISLRVNGELVEGNVLKGLAEVAWCGGKAGKSVSSWLRHRLNSSPVVILGAEDDEYRLTLEDVTSSLVFMYTPVTGDGVKGEPQYAMTDVVKAAAPSVSNVNIVGDAVEGNTISGSGLYFGGQEGASQYHWSRVTKNGGFRLVSAGSTNYTLTKDDVDHCIKFTYTPINSEGQKGESVDVMTESVKKAPPKVTNLRILGDTREGCKLTAVASVTGGTEGSSRVQWFKTSSSRFEGEIGLEALGTSKIAKTFRIPLAAAGSFIVAKYTPMAPDGEIGEPAYAMLENVVETLPPSSNFLMVTGKFSEGEMLTASYGYVGGHEGNSQYSWHLHEIENDVGIPIREASDSLQYRISKEAVGKFISFKCIPVRDDGVVGEPMVFLGTERVTAGSPMILSLELTGEVIEGSTLVVNKKYWGGEEGSTIFRWFQVNTDGMHQEIMDAADASYTLAYGDIGSHVYVSCEPVRSDGERGPLVYSEKIGPVLPGLPVCQSLQIIGDLVEGSCLTSFLEYQGGLKGECIHEWFRVQCDGIKEKLADDEFLYLTLDDVGCCLELRFTPVREDGVKGSPTSVTSDTVLPADPKGTELALPECFEDKEIVPLKTYFGGKEGMGQYTWYRTKEKVAKLELDEIALSNVVGETFTYTPSLKDVDFYLALRWVPTRDDGKTGHPLVAFSYSPVLAGLPVVSSVCLRETSLGIYTGTGTYYGGYEGSSLYKWYREYSDGNRIAVNGANTTIYEVTDLDYNCRLLFGYTPVRLDGIIGLESLSEPSEQIFPELPKIERLEIKGNEVEGEVLTAEVISHSKIQQLVWSNYLKEIKYQWFVSIGAGEYHLFEPMAGQCSRSYKACFEDIGRCLKCECTVFDIFGRTSEPVTVATNPILPGRPKIDKLEIEGRGFHTNLYGVRGIYSGGKEGKSQIQWLRSMVGSPDLISIPGEIGRMYEANVDDVGYRLVAVYTPVRDDGIDGQPVSASTDPISVEPEIHKEVRQKIELGTVKFEVLCDKDRSPQKALVMGLLERRILEVDRKRVKVVKPGSKTSFATTEVKGTYAPPFHVELYRNDQHRFKIVFDSGNEVDLMVQTRHMRDVIILVIRGLAQKFNSTSLNSLLRVDA